MAFTASKTSEIVGVGGVKIQTWDLTFGAVTEGIVSTGLNQVIACVHTNDTTEADGKLQRNKSAASTTANGSIFASSFTSNDVALLIVIGR